MLYPVMPVYLQSIGFSILLIGILEGIAEAAAGLSKGYFGKLSDTFGKRMPFVQAGYLLSAISKPLIVAFTYPLWVFFARTLDRLGKGIRTGARDAVLSDEATPETKGKVFGFHRGWDTLGAAIGPLIALVFLYFYPEQYTWLFLLAVIPGIISVVISFTLRDKAKILRKTNSAGSFFAFLKYWKTATPAYKKLVAGLLVFTLFNSSDVFLLLALINRGYSDAYMIGTYVFYNLVFALSAYPIGILADRIGLKKMLIAGLLTFAAVYLGMGLLPPVVPVFGALFILYGIYAAATDGISKALISNLAEKSDTATAIGFYTGFSSLCSLLASSMSGLLWFAWSPEAMFIVTGTMVLLVAVYFILFTFGRTN